MSLYTKDAFGFDIHPGDTVVGATTIIQSPGLRMGTVIKMQEKPYVHYRAHERGPLDVARWLVEWNRYPFETTHDELPFKSTVHGLNLYKVHQ